MKKKILIPSAMLVAGLTLGGYAMAGQPNKPVKLDTQSASTETTAPVIDMTPTGPATSAAPIATDTSPTDSAAPSAPLAADTSTTPPTPAQTNQPAQNSQPAQVQPVQQPEDNSKPGNHNQSAQTFTVTPIN